MYKRILLIIPIVSAFTLGFVENLRTNYYFVMSMCALSFYSLLINFPVLSYLMHKKPVYFEDLEDVEVDPSHPDRKKFQKYFITFSTIPFSLFMAILTGYFVYKVSSSILSPFEIAGIVGGNLSLYGNAQRKVGQWIIDILEWKKKKVQNQRRNSIELVENKV
jgi:hypothetical protein